MRKRLFLAIAVLVAAAVSPVADLRANDIMVTGCTVKSIAVNSSYGQDCVSASLVPFSGAAKGRFLVTANCGNTDTYFLIRAGGDLGSTSVDGVTATGKWKMIYSQLLAALLSGKKVEFKDIESVTGCANTYLAPTVVLTNQ